MAVLAQNLTLRLRGECPIEKFLALDTSAAQHVYTGMALIIDASEDTTRLRIADAVTCVDGDVFVGIAAGEYVVALGDAETTYPQWYSWPAIIGFPSTVFTNADLGKDVYVSAYVAAGVTLSASNGAYPHIGTLFAVEDGYAYVQLDKPTVLNVP
jgi:hypothetical protein